MKFPKGPQVYIISVPNLKSPFHSQVPLPGLSGGSVQFTAVKVMNENLQIKKIKGQFTIKADRPL